MLLMCPARYQSNPHIGEFRPCPYSPVKLFFQMRQNQSLPVPIQNILAATSLKLQPASPLCWLHQQMYFCIMAQRLKMTYPFHCSYNRFLVDDISGVKFHLHSKTFLNLIFQDINLNLSHHLSVNLLKLLIPDNMQLWLFLLQLS